MMAGNPNWWGINSQFNHPRNQNQNQFSSSDSSFCSSSPTVSSDFPAIRSWSQLLLGEEKLGGNLEKKQQQVVEDENNWEQVLNLMNPSLIRVADVKPQLGVALPQSTLAASKFYDDYHQYHPNTPHHFVSSPSSCTTAVSSTFNFSGGSLQKVGLPAPPAAAGKKRQLHSQDQSSECNSRGSGGVQTKKARVQQSTAQPALKVRKEKLGDRITALHQLVSPFGKTDTASVLSEAIGYIRFLQGQIEALSSPYMRNNASTVHHQHPIQEKHYLFPQEDAQFLNDHGRGRPPINQDLRSRGLCLVPISCTQYVANDSGADFWAPAAFGAGGGGF